MDTETEIVFKIIMVLALTWVLSPDKNINKVDDIPF